MKTTGKSITTRASRRVTATERFTAGAARPARPVRWIFLGIGGTFALVILTMVFVPSDRPEVDQANLDRKIAEARRLEAEGKFPESLVQWREAKVFAEERKTLQPQVRSIRDEARALEQTIAGHVRVAAEVRAFKVRVDRRLEELAALLADGRRLLEGIRESRAPAVAELREVVSKLEEEDRKRREEERWDNFMEQLRRITEKHGTAGDRGGAWGPAIAEWRVYLGRPKVTPDHRLRAEQEIQRLEVKAREEARSFRLRAESGRADIAEELRKAAPRFAGTAAEKDLPR